MTFACIIIRSVFKLTYKLSPTNEQSLATTDKTLDNP